MSDKQGKQPSNPMRFYESNYYLLLELIPELLVNGNYRYYYYGNKSKLTVDVLETAAYTQELRLHHLLHAMPEFLPRLSLDVRVYHDARLAEVHTVHGIGKLIPKFDYPNDKMLHKDEKHQANLLLHEWIMRGLTSMTLIRSARQDSSTQNNLQLNQFIFDDET